MGELNPDLSFLRRTSVQVADYDAFPEQGQANVMLTFSDGTRLAAAYWRLIIDGRRHLSSFDHEQKYGLPSPIDAKEDLRTILSGRECADARFDAETGDLHFAFAEEANLQVFNFTNYEIWTLYFADGRVQYSNYV